MWLFLALTANVLWSQHDIINSVLVRHHHRHPLLMTMIVSFFELCTLLSIVIFFPLKTNHALILILGGFSAYAGLIFYFWVIDHVDASVMSVSWAFTNLTIVFGAFLFFGERWTVFGSLGTILVLSGAFILTFWHHHVSMARTMCILALLGFLYAPLFLIQKFALLSGESSFTVLFWSILGQKMIALTFPFFFPQQRKMIVSFLRTGASMHFFALVIIVAILSIVGNISSTFAYSLAPASLVSVTLNTQPFMVIVLAWMWSRFFPRSAPRELLTAQSIGAKVVSFSLVFLGLALLSFSQ